MIKNNTRGLGLVLFVIAFVLTGCSSGGDDDSSSDFRPLAPNVVATPEDGQVVITWTNSSGATSYNLYWSTSIDINVNNATLVSNVRSGYVQSGLVNGTTYFFIVAAVNGGVEGAASKADRAAPSGSILLSSLFFPDANLSQCVSDLAASNGYIYVYELITLDCNNKGIKDLTGIEALTSLEDIRLGGNLITDISAISNLLSLDFIYMPASGNDISDLMPLGGLVNLTYLYLNAYFKTFSNTSALANLVNLEQLFIGFNNITDISFLTNMKDLIGLDLSGSSSISDYSVIFTLDKLEDLRLESTNLTDISQITSLSKLSGLNVYGNAISDFSPLTGLNQLQSLNIGGNNVSDISFIASLPDVHYLDIRDNVVSDISVLSGRANMTTLHIDNNNITDISVIQGMSQLNELWLGGNNITDFSVLTGISSLYNFEAANSGLGNTSFLVNNSNLTTLRLEGNNITSVSEFTGYPELSFLVLSDNDLKGQGVGNIDDLSILPLFRVILSGNASMSCAELGSLINDLGSPPVDTDSYFTSIDTAIPGVNCANP